MNTFVPSGAVLPPVAAFKSLSLQVAVIVSGGITVAVLIIMGIVQLRRRCKKVYQCVCAAYCAQVCVLCISFVYVFYCI